MANITGALYGVVNKPYKNYLAERSVIVGFSDGIYGLVTTFSTETKALS